MALNGLKDMILNYFLGFPKYISSFRFFKLKSENLNVSSNTNFSQANTKLPYLI